MCMVDGKVIEEREANKWNPRNIVAVLVIVTFILTGLGTVYGYQNLWFSSPKQKQMVLDYVSSGHSLTTKEVVDTKKHVYDSEDIHQPYKEKRKEWYTRIEAEKLEKRVAKIEELNRGVNKLIRLLEKEGK